MAVRFVDLWFLLLIGLIPLALWLRRPPSLLFSDVRLLDLPVKPSWRMRLRWVPEFLRALWLALAVVAMARPRTPELDSAVHENGLDIIASIDISGSMGKVESVDDQGRPMTRLDQVKRFVRDALLRDRPHDRVGMVSFSDVAELFCAPTDDHQAATELLMRLEVSVLDNRTNLGDAIVLAVATLREISAREPVVLLCSDGAHNVAAGLNPGTAARLAESLGVRIHCVGVGADEPDQPEGRDDHTLQETARITGGEFFRAANVTDLKSVADRLAEIEPSPAQIVGYQRWRDRFPECLLLALGLWSLEMLLRASWLHITPAG
jgi:Ca-activated chloride channel family protein